MRLFAVVTLALGSLLTAAPVAVADTTCNFSSSSFITVVGNLIVPDNGICNLGNSGSVSGNVTIGENASLSLEGNWTIAGYVQAVNCAYVAFNPYGSGSTLIGHNVDIESCTGLSPALGTYFPAGAAFGSFGPNSLIGSNFRCYKNAGPCILVHDHIGGNVHVIRNESSSGPSQINGNSIAKGLYCSNNIPAPAGANNWIAGNPNDTAEGQCKGF